MAAPARFPNFSDPAPVARRIPDAPTPRLIERTHIVILRDDKTGVRFMDQTILGQTFAVVVSQLVEAQIPLGCTLDSIRCDDGESPVIDVTERVLTAVLRFCNELGEDVAAPLAPAFEHYGIALPGPGEGSIAADVLTPGRRAAA